MNFVGHALVASFVRQDGPFVVGSMLPDFARMAGTRIQRVEDPAVEAGVRLHHATDDVFHGQSAFIDLQIATRQALTARGVPRPPALAVGHVGVELLLDGALLQDESLATLYLQSLEHAADVGRAVTWRAADGSESYRRLCEQLLVRGAPHVYRDPSMVAEIMRRILQHSDVLCMDVDHVPLVADSLAEVMPLVHAAADNLVQAVRAGLDERPSSAAL